MSLRIVNGESALDVSVMSQPAMRSNATPVNPIAASTMGSCASWPKSSGIHIRLLIGNPIVCCCQ